MRTRQVIPGGSRTSGQCSRPRLKKMGHLAVQSLGLCFQEGCHPDQHATKHLQGPQSATQQTRTISTTYDSHPVLTALIQPLTSEQILPCDPPWMSNLDLFVGYNYEPLLQTFSNPVRTSLNNYNFVISEDGFFSFIGRSSFQCSFGSKATIQRKITVPGCGEHLSGGTCSVNRKT